MNIFSWEYEFKGAVRSWAVGGIFTAVGLLCGLLLPYLFTPRAIPGGMRSDGTVIRVEQDDGMEKPVFQFTDDKGITHELPSGISSGRSAYLTGDKVSVMFDSANPSTAYVQDDKDMVMVYWILRLLGIVFGGIGLAVLGMKLRGMDDEKISRIGGLIGALAYAIPAIFVLPGLWFAYQHRPNALFRMDASFGTNEWVLGSIFTATGLIVLVITIALYRYQARTGEAGWNWNWEWSSEKKNNP